MKEQVLALEVIDPKKISEFQKRIIDLNSKPDMAQIADDLDLNQSERIEIQQNAELISQNNQLAERALKAHTPVMYGIVIQKSYQGSMSALRMFFELTGLLPKSTGFGTPLPGLGVVGEGSIFNQQNNIILGNNILEEADILGLNIPDVVRKRLEDGKRIRTTNKDQ